MIWAIAALTAALAVAAAAMTKMQIPWTVEAIGCFGGSGHRKRRFRRRCHLC